MCVHVVCVCVCPCYSQGSNLMGEILGVSSMIRKQGNYAMTSHTGLCKLHPRHTACHWFCKWHFTRTRPHLFIYVLSRATFALQQQGWVVTTETIWPRGPQCPGRTAGGERSGQVREASPAAPRGCPSPASPPEYPPNPIRGKAVFHETSRWCQKSWGPLTWPTKPEIFHHLAI